MICYQIFTGRQLAEFIEVRNVIDCYNYFNQLELSDLGRFKFVGSKLEF